MREYDLLTIMKPPWLTVEDWHSNLSQYLNTFDSELELRMALDAKKQEELKDLHAEHKTVFNIATETITSEYCRLWRAMQWRTEET